MTARKRVSIDAVYESDLQGLLEAFGLWEPFRSGDLSCSHCGGRLTLENLYGFIGLEDGGLGFVCTRPECVEAALRAPKDTSEGPLKSQDGVADE